MENSALDEVIKTSKVILHKGRYAYLKADEFSSDNHFLISKDDDEVTVVTEESNVSNVKYSDDVKWFKLVEIKVSSPFLAKGFLARITKAIADKNLNVLVVSTFSKDYILIREETFEDGLKALEEAGFPVERY